jgi:hypothetical protein
VNIKIELWIHPGEICQDVDGRATVSLFIIEYWVFTPAY